MECFCFVVKENWESKRIGVWELGRYCQVFVLNNGLWKVLVMNMLVSVLVLYLKLDIIKRNSKNLMYFLCLVIEENIV